MAFVQAVSVASSALVTVLTTPAITTTTGNFLSIGTSVLNNGNNPVPSDSYTNVWTGHNLNPIVISGQNDQGWSWYAKNITGGAGHTFTTTGTVASNSSIVVCEFSGRALDFPVAATDGSFDSVGHSPHSLGTVTTPFAGCDLLSFNFTSSTSSESFSTGGVWTIPANATNGSGNLYQPSFAQVYSNAAQGAFTNTWNSSDVVQGASFVYAIKQPSFTIIQQLQNIALTGQTTVVVPNSGSKAVTTGNLLLYVAKYSNSSVQTVTITDTLNNSWQQVNSFFDGANNFGITFGFAKNIVGGQDAITMTVGTASNFLGLYVVEISGLSATNPFTTGEFVINKVISPGNGTNGVATQFTGNIARRPAMLFGFCVDSTNSAGQVLTAGTNFNSLGGVWVFGGSQSSSLPEYQRI